MSTCGEIQLEGCYVKYNNTSYFGAPDKMEVCRRCGPSFGYNSDVLNRIDSALAFLVGGNGEYFREGDFGSIQGVAQCIQDLSLSDCQDCLSEATRRLRSVCETSSWGDMYLGKCYIRYADQGIYMSVFDDDG
ncbi:putative Gnk2-like domain-containing protein [Helianthus anomalus]